ncbi:MAG: phosphoadenylyl-sulfate reductase [Thermoflavifilum sp.]|nr:phosphoadenylyl-sulfate reductase [Thermoflavifilum sp.]
MISDTHDAEEILQAVVSFFPNNTICFSSSLGWEDQVITDMIWKNDLPIEIFTLDTGRLFPETYSLMEQLYEHYKKRIRVYFPDAADVEQLVNEKGPNCFYASIENRKYCCYVRKVKPLTRALQGMRCWITGIRAEQSPDRSHLPQVEWDEAHRVIKVHPLLHWTLDEVKTYVRQHHVPYNPLHDKGFVSIGCAPCTRAIRPGEDYRAGRWWWEDQTKKECGLHMTPTAS